MGALFSMNDTEQKSAFMNEGKSKKEFFSLVKKYKPLLCQAGLWDICAQFSSYNTKAPVSLVALSSCVAGPILYGFANFVLEVALGRGIKRLYFLSRDGFVLLTVARLIAQRKNLDVDLRYLYTSRLASNAKTQTVTRSSILHRILPLGTQAELEKAMQLFGFKNEDLEKELSDEELIFFKEGFFENKKICNYIEEISLACRKNAERYFAQEGLFSAEPYAFVDTGWQGTIQSALKKLLGRDILCLYAGVTESKEIPESERGQYEAYLFSPKNPLKYEGFNNSLFEVFFQHTDGMTVGYEMREKMEPLFLLSNAGAQPWSIKDQQSLILDFAKLACERGIVPPKSEWVKKVFSLLCQSPSKKEAALYGAFIFSDEMGKDEETSLAPFIPKRCMVYELVPYRLRARLGIRCEKAKTFWKEASFVRTSPFLARLIKQKSALNKWRKKLPRKKI